MKTIWKYILDNDLGQIFAVTMKDNAKILSIQVQQAQICLWAEVDSDAVNMSRYFIIYPTGFKIIESERYNFEFLGTVQLFNGTIVHHVYECKLL